MSEKKVVGRNVAIVLGVICIILSLVLAGTMANYNSMLKDKEDTISSLYHQISVLNATISEQNHFIAEQNATIKRLQKLENLVDQIFYLYGAFDTYSSEWNGRWVPVATFKSQEKTPTFQIQSPFNIWRFNYSHTGTEDAYMILDVIQVVNSHETVIRQFNISGPSESFSMYLFSYGVYEANIYYFKTYERRGIVSWTITVEQLDIK